MNHPRKSIFVGQVLSNSFRAVGFDILSILRQWNMKFNKISCHSVLIVSLYRYYEINFCLCLLFVINTQSKKSFIRTIHPVLNQVEFSIWWYKRYRSIILEFGQSNTLMKFDILNIDCLFAG